MSYSIYQSRSRPNKEKEIWRHPLENYVYTWLYPTYLQRKQNNQGFRDFVNQHYPQLYGKVQGAGTLNLGESMLDRSEEYSKLYADRFNPYEVYNSRSTGYNYPFRFGRGMYMPDHVSRGDQINILLKKAHDEIGGIGYPMGHPKYGQTYGYQVK